jgi:nucleotide-binding universal stress UspA family protein
MSSLHFAVASTFSPRFRSVLAEADRAARMFGARLSVLHAGERTQEKAASFQEAFADLGRENVEIYWCEGGSPAEVLVTAAANEKFDLFIAGTIARPNDPRNFTGTIVRELFSRTPCDLLLIPDPKEQAPAELNACLLVEAHSPRWRAAKETLKTLKPSKISILAADSPFALARRSLLGAETEEGTLEDICEELSEITPAVDLLRIRSNTGFMICEVVQETGPDFLFVESGWKAGHRILPPYLGWHEQVIPSRLFLFGKPPSSAMEEGAIVLL